jgi:hypothetical protein
MSRGSVTAKCLRGHKRDDGLCSSRCRRWYFVLEAPPSEGGSRKRQWSRAYATRRDAEVALREELGRRDQGIILSAEKVTLAGFVDRWLAHMASLGRDGRTVERYGELLRLHVLPTLGALQLRQLTPMDLSDLYARLLREGRRDGRAGGSRPARSATSTVRCTGRSSRRFAGSSSPGTSPPTSSCRPSRRPTW